MAYGFMLTACLKRILRDIAMPRDGIAVRCEEMRGVKGFATDCFERFTDLNGVRHLFHGIAFREKRAFRELQVADMWAYESAKFLTMRGFKKDRTTPPRKLIRALDRTRRLYAGYFSDRTAKENAERWRHTYGDLPAWPSPNAV